MARVSRSGSVGRVVGGGWAACLSLSQSIKWPSERSDGRCACNTLELGASRGSPSSLSRGRMLGMDCNHIHKVAKVDPLKHKYMYVCVCIRRKAHLPSTAACY